MASTKHKTKADVLDECQAAIGYQFRDVRLLQEALTHASGANHRLVSNERLEFLGDAILGAIVCEAVFRRFPDELEGELTRIKSTVVSRLACAQFSQRLGIGEYLVIGKGMGSHDKTPPSVLADVFESLIGAIYLDGGIEAARAFIARNLEGEIEAAALDQHGVNYKSNLQQIAQRDFGATPTYLLLDEKGPDHSKCFKIAAQVGDHGYAPAWGSNKKEAEQRAALNALREIAGLPAPHPAD